MGRHSRRGLFLLGLLLWLGRAVPSAAVEGTCASPTVIPSGGGVFTGTTSGASAITLSCQTNTSLAPESVFVWTPAVSGTAVFSTAHSNFDTVLAVETQCGVASSTLAGGCVNDGAACCGGCNGVAGLWDSTVTVTVNQGVPLFVIVDGYGSCSAATCTDRNSGPYRLVVTPPGVSTTTLPTCPATTTTATTSSTTTTTVVPPSYPQNLQVHTISCGATPTVRLTWNASTRGTNPIAGYIVYKFNGSIGQFKPDHCSNTCPGGSSNGDACCPEDFAGGVLTLNDGVTCVVNAECTGNQTPWACCTGNGTGTCNAPGTCHFTEILDTPGFRYYSVAAYDQSTPPSFSQPPSTCPSWSAVQQGGGTCGPYAFSGCTPWPCFQCTCDTTTGCNTGWCDPMASAKCGDCSTCLVATTTTTTTSTTTTTTALSTMTWAKDLGGTGEDRGYAVTADASGNVIAAGQFSGTISNLGSPCATMTSHGAYDAFALKYSSTGSCLWRRSFGSASQCAGAPYNGASCTSAANCTGPLFNCGTCSSNHCVGGAHPGIFCVANNGCCDQQIGACVNFATAYGIAVDNSGNVIVVGSFEGTVDFGNAIPITSKGSGGSNADMFVAKYAAADGHYLWAETYGAVDAQGPDAAFGVAVDGLDNVLVTGNYTGQSTCQGGGGGANTGTPCVDNSTCTAGSFGPGLCIANTGYTDFGNGYHLASASGVTSNTPVVLSLNGATGATTWARSFPSAAFAIGYGVAADRRANCDGVGGTNCILVNGNFTGRTDFGNGIFVSSNGAADIFTVKLSSSGTYRWSNVYGSNGADTASAIAVDTSGDVVETGYYASASGSPSMTLGGACGSITSAGSSDAFLAKLSGTDGSCVWAKTLGGLSNDIGTGVATNATNEVFVTGIFPSTANFGGGNVSPGSSQDIFVAKFSTSGGYLSAQHYASSSSVSAGNNVAVSPANGNVLLTGAFAGSNINFISGTISSQGGNDAFVLSRAP